MNELLRLVPCFFPTPEKRGGITREEMLIRLVRDSDGKKPPYGDRDKDNDKDRERQT